MTVFVVTTAAACPGTTFSIVRSMMRSTLCVMAGGAWSIKDTVTIPVAMDVTNETRRVRRTICDLESSSIFIPLEIGRGRYLSEPYFVIVSNIDHHICMLFTVSSSAISNGIHTHIIAYAYKMQGIFNKKAALLFWERGRKLLRHSHFLNFFLRPFRQLPLNFRKQWNSAAWPQHVLLIGHDGLFKTIKRLH